MAQSQILEAVSPFTRGASYISQHWQVQLDLAVTQTLQLHNLPHKENLWKVTFLTNLLRFEHIHSLHAPLLCGRITSRYHEQAWAFGSAGRQAV